MFQSKKKKIQKYLEGRELLTSFDELLKDCISGVMKAKLIGLGVEQPELHIDFLDGHRCIGIQGWLGEDTVDIQAEESEMVIGIAPDEPEQYISCPLESREQFYQRLAELFSEAQK